MSLPLCFHRYHPSPHSCSSLTLTIMSDPFLSCSPCFKSQTLRETIFPCSAILLYLFFPQDPIQSLYLLSEVFPNSPRDIEELFISWDLTNGNLAYIWKYPLMGGYLTQVKYPLVSN